MQGKRIVLYVFIGLVAFVFSSGFLGFCVGPDYVPASIEFTDPPNGMVLDKGTDTVTIHGRVVAGDSEPLILKAEDVPVPFNKTTGDFEFVFALNPDRIYSTCTFQVIDNKGIINKERISFAVGDSLEFGAEGVVDDAVLLSMTEDFMEMASSALVKAKIYELFELPMVLDLKLCGIPMGTVEVNELYFGDMNVDVDIQAGGNLFTNIDIAPAEGVNPESSTEAALYIHGMAYLLGFIPTPLTIWAEENVLMDNVGLILSQNEETNQIIASLDLTVGTMELSDPHVKIIGIELPDWLVPLIIDMLPGMLAEADLDMPLMNMDDLTNIIAAFVEEIGQEIEGVELETWFMDEGIFTSTDDDMTINLGLSAEFTDPDLQKLDKFYATPGDPLPEIYFTEDENLIMAISDDMMNQNVSALTQAGFIQGMDVTELFKEQLGPLASKDLEAYAYLDTPPIFDFSGEPLLKTMGEVHDFGRFIVRNMIIEVYNACLVPSSYPSHARISIDINAALKVTVSETDDGIRIQGGMDLEQSESFMMILYNNTTNPALLLQIGGDIANTIVNNTLKKMIDIEIPMMDFLENLIPGIPLNIDFVGTELSNNYLVTKLHIY